jgi:phosphoribosyl 1,2-cyclic phosphate phosphodiesterase
LKIKFLGTGTSQGIPVIGCNCKICKSKNQKDKRLRSSIYINYKNQNFVVDTGPDFRQQVLTNNIKKIDFVLYTHAHRDHTSGIDELRSFNFIQKKSITAFGNENLVRQLKKDFSYIFSGLKYPGLPKIDLKTIKKNFIFENLNIKPIKVMHHKLEVLGYRIKDFTYITDANKISVIELQKIKGSKVLVLNCLQINKHISHFNLEEAIDIVKKLKVKKTYFTHISHNLGNHILINKLLPNNISLAYDGLEIDIK